MFRKRLQLMFVVFVKPGMAIGPLNAPYVIAVSIASLQLLIAMAVGFAGTCSIIGWRYSMATLSFAGI